MKSFAIGPCLVEASLNRVRRNGDIVQLEPKVVQVLVCLAEAQGQVVKKEDIIRSVWTDTFVTDDVLTRSISLLRKVLGDDPREPCFIETIPKVGYRLIAPVEEAEGAHGASLLRMEGHAQATHRRSRWLVAAAGGLLAIVAGLLFLDVRGLRTRLFTHPTARGQIRLVVLPFENMSGDSGEEYFSDGMTEELITNLSRLSTNGLGVVARTSAMHYKHSSKTIEEIGHELAVDYVLEGSVRRSGTRVRVAAQLVQVRDQVHLWADEYDSQVKDVLGLQAQISQSVAQAIRIRLRVNAAPPRTVSPGAYQLFLKGRYFLELRGTEGLRNALRSFQESVHLDPNYGRAWGGVALSYELLEYDGVMSPRESYPDALSAATRAVQLDPDSAEAHLALAYVHEHYEWNWDEEDREIERAMELDPGYELARRWFSYALLCRGEVERAIEEMRRALSLNPLSPQVRTTMASRLASAGRRNEAIQELQEAIELNPRNSAPYFYLTDLYKQQQEFEKAGAAYRRALELDDKPVAAARFERLRNQNGFSTAYTRVRQELIKSQIAELNRGSGLGLYASPGRYVVAYASLGEVQKTLEWLQRAYDEHSSIMLELRDPLFDFVRQNPQFVKLLRRVNMTGPKVPTSSR